MFSIKKRTPTLGKKDAKSKKADSELTSSTNGSKRSSVPVTDSADIVLINSLFKAASRYQQKQQYDHALARYQELKDIFVELPREQYELVMRRDAHVSFLVGMTHEARNDFVKAMDHYSDAVKIYRENRILIADYGTRHPGENIQPTLLKVNYKLVQVMACMGSLQPKLNLTKWDFALNINSTALKLLDAVVHQCPELYDNNQSRVIRETLQKNVAKIIEKKSQDNGQRNTTLQTQTQASHFQCQNIRDDDYTIDENVPFRDLILNIDDQMSIDSSVSGLTKLLRDDGGPGVAETLVSPFLIAGEKAYGAFAALDATQNKTKGVQ